MAAFIAVAAEERRKRRLNNLRRIERRQLCCNVLTEISDQECVRDYRLTRECLNDLINMLRPHLHEATRSSSISPELQVSTMCMFTAACYIC
jgi:transcriptional regulator of met regulon